MITIIKSFSMKKLWLAFLIIISMRSFEIPVFNVSIYMLVYPVIFVILFGLMTKYRITGNYINVSVQKTMITWGVIFLWGILLCVGRNIDVETIKDLLFVLCWPMAAFCFSYYYAADDAAKYCKKIFVLAAFLIGISGIYEAITGDFYHVTHVLYLTAKNAFGLYKPNTIFMNINDSATFMFMALVIAFLFSEDCVKKNLVRVLAVVVFGGNILFTESRGVLLGTALFLYVIFVATSRRRKTIVYVIAGIPLLFFFLLWFTSTVDFSDANLTEMGGRGFVWRNSLTNLQKSYFLGLGPGQTVHQNELLTTHTNYIAAVHNFFLEVLCDYGIVGGAATIVWFWQLIKSAAKIQKHTFYGAVVLGALIGFVPVSISSSSLIGKVWVVCFFGLITAELNKQEFVLQSAKGS